MVRSSDSLRIHGEYHLDCNVVTTTSEDSKISKTEEMETDSEFICHCGQKFDDSEELQNHSLDHLQQVTTEHFFKLQKEM